MVTTAQNMNHKPGYKQTEVGVIPQDWEVKRLEEIASISSGGTPDRLNPTYWGGDIPWVTTTQINFNLIDKASEFVTRKGLENSATRVYSPGTLLMAMYGQGKTRGKVAVLRMSAAINQACAAIKVNKGVSIHYVFFNLSARYEEIRSLSNTGNQENLNATIIKNVLLPLPQKVQEQQAIATALSDVDALITSLDKLIAKKRDIKQATMQQLLTGKMRLPGFSGELKPTYKQTEVGMIPEEWQVCSLGDIVTKVGSGITPTGGEKVYTKEGRPFVRSQNVGWGSILLDDIVFINEETHSSFSSTEIRVNDVFLNITGASIGRSAVADNTLLGGNVNQHVCIIRADASKLSPHYLNFFLLSKIGQKQIDSFQAGGNRQGLNFGQIKSFQIPLTSVPEQQAIATVLSDMDAEIVALEQRRYKTRALKQGMMQELLTGRTRLL